MYKNGYNILILKFSFRGKTMFKTWSNIRCCNKSLPNYWRTDP